MCAGAEVQMKRILLLIKGLGRGGAEQLLVSAVRYANRARFTYEVAYLLPWKDAFVSELHTLGASVSCLNGSRGVAWVPRLRRLVKSRGVDLVHVHSPYAAPGARLGLGQMPLVCTEHIVWESLHPATYWGNILTYPRNDHVFAVSESVRTSIRYPWPVRFLPMPRLETLHHGPDPSALANATKADGIREEFGISKGAPLVATVANFRADKGYPYLIQAAALVRKAIPATRFIFVGVGPTEDETRRGATRLGLEGTVVFAGYREDVPSILSACDLFVLASVHEGLPISLMEAMALGTPAVVTNVGGNPEIIEHGEQGLLVRPGDPRALAENVVSLLLDDTRRARLGQAARERAASFSIAGSVRRIEQVYEELLQ
jgi:glycosyltransferase involved in cell wall biosynthesis